MQGLRSTYLLLLVACAIALPAGAGRAQDISAFTVHAEKDVFGRASMEALRGAPVIDRLPALDCAVEYVRRAGGKDIVYRRGPIALHLQDQRTIVDAGSGSNPASGAAVAFSGGILVDLARPGETGETVPSSAGSHKYMLRAAVVPQSYTDNVLHATIVLERAVVSVDGMDVTVHESEVFSRPVDIHGNEPLHFALPAWDLAGVKESRSIPPELEEALLITLETPRNFGFARNSPEPFSNSTLMTYAVPAPCTVSLRIRVKGGDRIIDEGPREPGVYSVAWDSHDLPDGRYTATLSAVDGSGKEMHVSDILLTKDHSATQWTPPVFSSVTRSQLEHFAVSTESGLAYQLPADSKKGMRNMFTHIAVRLGYRFTRWLEAGVLVGQDAFNEKPGPDVDILRISDYGGVVAYTYGYAGPYARITPWNGSVQPVLQLAAGFTDKAAVTEIGAGVRALVLDRIELFLMPTVMSHLRNKASTKVGLEYGVTVRF